MTSSALEASEKALAGVPGSAAVVPPTTEEEPAAVEGGGFALGAFVRVFKHGSTTDYLLEALGVIAAIGSGVALALVNVVMGRFMNVFSVSSLAAGIPSDFMQQAQTLALYFVYIGIARFTLTYVYSSLFTFVGYHLTRNVRYQYLRAALSQEIGYFDRGVSGSVSMQATSNGKLIQSGIGEKLGLFIQAVATFVAAFIIAFVTQWKLTLIVVGIIPLLIVVMGGVGAADAKCETDILKTYAQAASYAETTLSGVRTVHAFSLRSRIVARYNEFLQHAFNTGKKKNVLYGVMFGGEYFIVYAGMALAFWQGIAMLSRGEVQDIGTIFTVIFSVIIAASTVTALAPHMIAFSRASSAAAELFALIDRVSQINPFDPSGEKPGNVEGSIEVEAITFSYPTRPNTRVLDNFTLSVPAGKVTALVGASGSGKSTIVGLLERWYDPQSGSIRLDGQDITRLNVQWLRTNIRLVQQEPVLFNGSVYDNIVNGLVGTQWENASRQEQMERVQEAAKLAFAHDFVLAMPQGYDTRIGERGGLLSGGQKQRIAIARSIISNPKILLLDEATSALDPHSEGVVQQALDSAAKDRTTIVIAHKLATIRHADNIVVMSKGRIVEQGPHDELVARGGAYASLVKAQDLAPAASHDSKAESTDQESEKDQTDEIAPTKSLGRYPTAVVQRLASLKDREDHDLYDHAGLIRNIYRLLRLTPSLHTWYFVILISCSAGGAIFPGQAILLSRVMEIFTAQDPVQQGNFIALMFFVLALGCLLAYFVLGWGSNVVAQTLSMKMRGDLMNSLLKQDLRFFDRPENTVGALTSRLDSFPQAVLELMGFNIALVVMSFITVTASGVLAIVVSWKLGLVGVFVGMPPMILAGLARIRLDTRMDANMGKRFSNSASVASEAVIAIRTVSSLAIESQVLSNYTHELDQAISQTSRSMFHMMVWFSLTQSIEYFILALGFWWGAKLISEESITVTQFMISFMAVYFAGQASGQLFSFSSSFTKANEAANYYFWLTSLQPTVQETDENKEKGPERGCQSYDFEDVRFSYPLAPEKQVLKGISLKIQPGQFVAFVGASGCGKSTMISLLERFYDPTSGTIKIDSTSDLTSISPILYRRHLSLVQQEPALFPGSIRENISHGLDIGPADNVPDTDIEAACRAANAWDFVSSLPEGLNTPCGTGGSQLSGGQRQRIAIARALVRNPAVILLDEATSALDTESERLVQAALADAAASGDRITIAVAHRLSTIRGADRIFVFYDGRIAEEGTHSELLEQAGMYKMMCEAQSLDRAV